MKSTNLRAFAAWHYLLATTTTATAPVVSSAFPAFAVPVTRSRVPSSATASSSMMSSMSSPPPSSPSSSSSSSKGGASDRCTDRRREIASDDGTKESTTIITALPSSSSSIIARRSLLLHRVPAAAVVVSSLLLSCRPPAPAFADFAPGGTLLDREISVTYGNPEASKSRNRDNSNVLFDRDNYYKFGSAAPWIDPPGSTDFPKTVPFVPSQQRYDALKKYGYRIVAARNAVSRIGGATAPDDVPDRTDPTYQLRALGLLANAFLATENTGTTNELMLARWYVNEMYLGIGDYRDALSGGGGRGAGARVLRLPRQGDEFVPQPTESVDIEQDRGSVRLHSMTKLETTVN